MVEFIAKVKKCYIITFIILAFIFAGNVMCITLNKSRKIATNVKYSQFAGSATCVSCHKEIYKSHINTAHYKTSRPAAKEFIKGSFEEGKNHYIYNKWMEVVLEKRNDSFYQTAYMNGIEMESKPFDIVIGSGRKGQTYLYWDSANLFQLPVSYYTPSDAWCNSPGYSNSYIRFNRSIPGQCLECHGTYAKVEDNEQNESVFDKNEIIYGVDCERCHGPSADHVAFHTNNPGQKTGRFVINPGLLSRQQKIDGCALCHSGFRKAIQPAFSFVTGEKLNEYFTANYKADSASTLDVHGNQYGLLASSRCFKNSLMDCSSCHNVHKNEANSPKIFSQRCISCHNESLHNSCTLQSRKGLALSNNCIDCHMPLLPSQKILLQLSNSKKSTPDLVRTHFISIYPEETKKFLKKNGL